MTDPSPTIEKIADYLLAKAVNTAELFVVDGIRRHDSREVAGCGDGM